MSELSPFTRRFREVIAQEPQQDVARRLGYTQSRVSQVARGEKPSRELVERLVQSYALPREEWLSLAGYGPRPTVEDERETIASRAAELALTRLGWTPEVLAVADELKETRESLADVERAIAELSAEIDRVVNERNPGAGKGVTTFPKHIEADPAAKLRALTVLLAEARAGRLDRPKESS